MIYLKRIKGITILVFLLLQHEVFSQEKFTEKLPNKLSVVLQETNQGDEVLFYLLVKTGSLNESKRELGYAHFIEHLAFKKTQNFKGSGVDHFFMSQGLEVGKHYNALTNYDYTVYQVKLPKVASEELQNDVILFFKDILNGLALSQEDIDDEKKIILAEKLKRGLPNEIFNLKLGNSLYLNRLPIGTNKSINLATSSKIRGYYNNWYQPKNSSLVVLGNFNKDKISKSIRELLSLIPNTSSTTPKRVSIFKSLKNKLIVHSNKSLKKTKSSVLLAFHVSKSDKINKLNTCFVDVLKDRISNIFNKEGVSVNISYSYFLSDVSYLQISSDSESSTNKIIEVIFTELKRLREFGISENELQKFVVESKGKNNKQEFSNEFLINKLIDSIIKPEFFNSKIEVTKADLLAHKKTFFDNAKHIVHVQYNKEKITKKDINKTLKKVKNKEIKKLVYADQINQKVNEVAKKHLLVKVEDLNQVEPVSIKFFRHLGMTKLTYKNGLKVFLKPIKDSSKKFTLIANAVGGYKSVSDEEFYKFGSSEAYVGLGGVANLTYEEKGTYKFEHNISLSLSISDFMRQIYATSDQKNQGDFFKYLYAVLTKSKIDVQEFKKIVDDEVLDLINNKRQLRSIEKDRVVASLTGEYFSNRRQVETAKDYLQLDINQMFDFYKKSFSYADNWNYFIVGDFSVDSLTPILNTYMSNLKKSKNPFKNSDFDFEINPDKQFLVTDSKNKSQVVVMYLPIVTSLKSRLLNVFFKDYLSRELSELLRAKYGLLYSPPVVSLIVRQTNNPVAIFKIEYSCGKHHLLKSKYYLDQFLTDFSVHKLTDSRFIQCKRKIQLDFDNMLNSKEDHLWGEFITDNYFNVEEVENMSLILSGISKKDFVSYIKKLKKIITIKEFSEN